MLQRKQERILRLVAGVVLLGFGVQQLKTVSQTQNACAKDEMCSVNKKKEWLESLPVVKEVASVVLESTESTAANSATGSLFSGKPFRSFQSDLFFEPGWQKKTSRAVQGLDNNDTATEAHPQSCSHWAVVTTISGPMEAVLLAANLPGWCTVVVADNKTPNNYVELANRTTSTSSAHMFFLSVSDQKKWAQQSGKVGAFVKSIPWNHFARKNIGYMYAIQHGAQIVFDFDDDNLLLKDTQTGATLDPLPNKTHLERVRVPMVGTNVLNHHALMNASIPGSWPRGFPLEQLQDAETLGSVIAFQQEAVPLEELAVLQFCAQGDPDIDAIHRLVKPLPMNFAPEGEDSQPIQIPTHAFTPYNAQASIHTYNALWATLLPFSVPGRVSDIWRGYFAEAIFRALGISVAFLPRVRQDRNTHNYLADMQAGTC